MHRSLRLSLALLVTTLLWFSGCGKDETATPADSAPAPPQAEQDQTRAPQDAPASDPMQGDQLDLEAERNGSATGVFPRPGWQESPDPLASRDAIPGGTITMYAGPSPKSLNYYLETSVTSAMIFSFMFETLLDSHPVTLADEPGLAHKWEISADKRTFTFWIDPRARWSDGKPITAQDVKWTFDMIMDPKNLTGPHKVSMERFTSVEVIDELGVRFHAKEIHWANLQSAGSFHILPKHAMQALTFNEVNFEFPVVSGLYRLDDFKEQISLTMAKRHDYWNADSPRLRGKYNFDGIVFRFFNERDNAFESFKKGTIDFFPVYTSHRWVKDTNGERYEKSWIVKQRIYNYNPVGFQGFAMNMRRFPFDDLRVRKAMAHLLNRPLMNERLMYNLYFLHKSYYEDLYTPENPCPNEQIEFDKDKARQLLAEAGWKPNPQTGILEKDGKPFEFEFLTRSATSDRFLAIYSEDLKDIGIIVKTVQKDWAAWMKDMDSFNFNMTWAAWGAGVRKDPESMWHSKEAERQAGNNITGFKSAKVDALIEKQKTIFDLEERHTIVRQIDQLIYPEMPYALLWNLDYTRLLYWNKFGTPPTVLGKYGDERAALSYWWFDPDSEADLERARNDGLTLPSRPAEIRYDDEVR